MENPLAIATAERVHGGKYLVQANAESQFALGKTNTMMTVYNVTDAARFYITGPFYFFKLTGTVTLSLMPDGLVISEGGIGSAVAEKVIPPPDGPDLG